MKEHIKADTSYLSFYKLEKEMDLFSLQYQGVHYWQLVRVALLERIQLRSFNLSCMSPERNFIKEISGAILSAYKMKCFERSLKKADVVNLHTSAVVSKNGKLDDPQFDYFTLEDGIRTVDLYALSYYLDVPGQVQYTMAPAEAVTIFWKIKRKLFGVQKLEKVQQSCICAFLTQINDIYQMNFAYSEVLDSIQYVVNCYKIYKGYYHKLFQRLSAKLVIMDLHYADKTFPAISAARELGIKTIELQHGAICNHKAFWYEDHEEAGKILPDYFFVYGQWWKEQINLPPCVNVIPVGSPYMEEQVKHYPVVQRSKRTVTFFSNVISGLDLIALIKNNLDTLLRLDYRIVFKLHPEEIRNGWKKEYPYLVNHPNIEVVERESIYKLLAESDIVIGISSTVFFEALAYENVQIALLTHVECNDMRPLLDSGLACGISGDEDFVKLLGGSNQRDRIPTVDKSAFWTPNAQANTVAYIMNLLGKSES